MKIQVSLISVNYKVEKELISCISSIIKSKPKVSYEIIVVDNNETNTLKKVLREKFPQIIYVKSPGNIGFGAGNNLGAKSSSGEFLFFLNPDTTVFPRAVDVLLEFFQNKKNVGIVAPLLFKNDNEVYSSQGSRELGVLQGIVVLSFLNKLFPNNPISKKYFICDWNKKNIKEVDVVPGTAFMIRRSLFSKVKGFDERFFLFFEEFDLCKRIKELGYNIFIAPEAKVKHIWEASTKKSDLNIKNIFKKSRFYYFKKHHGILFALMINLISGIGKHELMLGLIIGLSVFLGFFKIGELMTFIGDQGWFYLSARDMLINGSIPLVGIASSHPWLHQGPLWTYMLGLFLFVFNFNPVSGAYLTIILGTLSVLGMYAIGAMIFSKRVGLIASLLYATSPLVVFYMRLPYHTSPIPIFVIGLIFSLHKIIQNKLIYLPLSIFFLSILYNFEIATVVLWPVVAGILGYKLFISKIKFKETLNKKILILSAIGLVVPLLPMILYDVRNGFPQTLKFIAWIFYRAISFFGYNQQHEFSIDKIVIMFNFLFDNFRKLVFAQSNFVSFIIFAAIISWIVYLFFNKEKNNSHYLILLLLFIPLALIVFNQTPSDAYLPIFFPVLIILLSAFLNDIMSKKKMLLPISIFLIVLVMSNINFMFKNDFIFDKSSRMYILYNRIQAVKEVLNIVEDKDYNLIGKGSGSEYESFTMNYEYLTWWLGHAPLTNNQSLKIYILESAHGIKIESLNNK